MKLRFLILAGLACASCAITTPHNVLADDKSFTSGDPKTSGSFRHAFLRAGTFAYQCVVHPTMTGTITVR